jgi:hypothetical protein
MDQPSVKKWFRHHALSCSVRCFWGAGYAVPRRSRRL